MEGVIARPKQSYVFDHKLTDEEIEELIENYDYDPKYLDPDYDDGGTELEPVYDRYGNPTEATIRALYEDRHEILSEPMTLEELHAWAADVIAEADAEMEAEEKNETYRTAQRISA